MKLYLVRHGQAMQGLVDRERVLSAEGRREAGTLAQYLLRTGVNVSQIWHSGKARARETAEILREDGQLSETISERTGLSPNDSVDGLVHELEVEHDDLCVVSHLPFVSTLASTLVTGGDAAAWSFQTCAMLSLEREGSGRWWVNGFVRPKDLE